MNTEHEDDENEYLPSDKRPLGYWLRAVDALLKREFAQALEAEGISRRDWMLLNVLSGDVDAPGLSERLARKGKRLRSLEDRGWVEEAGDGTWTLTEAGRAEKERIGGIVDGIRSRLVDAVGAEAFATTMSSLEAMARELGWDENEGFGRGFGPGPGFGRGFPGGPGFGRPFTPEIRFGWGPNRHRGFAPGRPGQPAERGDEPFSGHAPGDGCHGHGHHGGHGFPHRGHGHGFPQRHGHHGQSGAEGAYERGFDAGFARGRESGAA
jgi:hypothetical protein